MESKIYFANYCKIDFFITQCNLQDLINKYKSVLKSNVASIPSGGLDLDYFYPNINFKDRLIDIGFRAHDEPWYFGHQERKTLMSKSYPICKKLNLSIDFSMNENKRFNRKEWGIFLNNCKSIISSNTGFDYFDTNDNLRNLVNAYPAKNFEEIYKKFFKDRPNKIINRQISGRNIEAAGTKTLQILVEGNYNNFFYQTFTISQLKKTYQT